jgi:Tol biopolymer transport system component
VGHAGEEGPAYTYESYSWSPDGKWIVAERAESHRLELVSVETGEAIPLPFAGRFNSPVWKP